MRRFAKKQSVYANERVVEVKPQHKQKEYPIVKTVMFILLLLYALSLVFPLFWMFLASLKDQVEYSTGNVDGVIHSINAFPRQWLFSNYIKLFFYKTIPNKKSLTQTFLVIHNHKLSKFMSN